MAFIYRNPYKNSHMAALQELEQLQRQRKSIDQRIEWLIGTIKALKPLAEQEAEHTDVGLTDLCVKVLEISGQPRTVPEIRDALQRMGVDLSSSYSNPMAVLHTTLKRLADREVVEPVISTKEKKVGYRLKK